MSCKWLHCNYCHKSPSIHYVRKRSKAADEVPEAFAVGVEPRFPPSPSHCLHLPRTAPCLLFRHMPPQLFAQPHCKLRDSIIPFYKVAERTTSDQLTAGVIGRGATGLVNQLSNSLYWRQFQKHPLSYTDFSKIMYAIAGSFHLTQYHRMRDVFLRYSCPSKGNQRCWFKIL